VCPCRPLCSPKNTHILDGEADDLYKECEDYEAAIKAAGGIDLFLGGIGAGEWDVPRWAEMENWRVR